MFFLPKTITHAPLRRQLFLILQKNSIASEGAIALRNNQTPRTFNVKSGTEMHKSDSHEQRNSIKQFSKVQERRFLFSTTMSEHYVRNKSDNCMVLNKFVLFLHFAGHDKDTFLALAGHQQQAQAQASRI